MENQVEHVHQVPEKSAEELMKEFMDIVHNFKGDVRRPNEEYNDYRNRIAKEKLVLKAYSRGRVMWAGDQYIKSVHGELK
jgi:hypothetical protein